MTDVSEKQLLRWLIARSTQRAGVPLETVDRGWVETLLSLVNGGKAFITQDPPLVWVHPRLYKDTRARKHSGLVCLESDLSPEVPLLKHVPDRDSMPAWSDGATRVRLNGEPIFRPRDEPSELYALGCLPWPPTGTEIHARRYREHRARFTESAVSDLHVMGDRCPVCGRTDARKPGDTSNNPECGVCELWAKDIRRGIRVLEEPPPVEPPAKKGKRSA